ncbi:MAG: ATPase [Alphaproteobacteria bacterium]|nr:ATPase [Alphaproteobacteria bacterium]
MSRLAEIESHIGSMQELLEIVGAMRSLAGMRVQEAQRSLPGVRRYAESLAAGIADTLLLDQGAAASRGVAGPGAVVLCTSEHGFVGGFNEHLVDAVGEWLGPRDLLFVLGGRGAALAEERGRKPRLAVPMATRCAAATETVQRLTEELYRLIARGSIAGLAVVFARYRQGSQSAVERRSLLPIDVAAPGAGMSRQPPLHNLSAAALQEKLTSEYVFALLMEAVVESIASENAARLAAMEAARQNVSRKLDGLRRDAREARQSEITAELLDLVTGAEAQAAG